MIKFGYNEWIHLLELFKKQNEKYVEEMRLILERHITKFKDLNLVPMTSNKHSSSSTSASVPWKRTFKGVIFLHPYGKRSSKTLCEWVLILFNTYSFINQSMASSTWINHNTCASSVQLNCMFLSLVTEAKLSLLDLFWAKQKEGRAWYFWLFLGQARSWRRCWWVLS